jgi:hypothetical protein
MPVASTIVLEGLLKPDGSLELRNPPVFPPGRVRVTLEALPGPTAEAERWPDPPWPEESVPAPFDLPPPLRAERVQARQVTERLPDPFPWIDEAGA